MGNSSDVGKSRGGRARARALDPSRRREIARKGAQVRWQRASENATAMAAPLAIHPATQLSVLKIGDIELPCAVLSDRTRVITHTSVIKTLGRGYGGKSIRLARSSEQGGPPLPGFLSGRTIEPFVTDSLRVALNNPILFRTRGGVRRAVNASLVPEICEVWLKARDAGALQKSQEPIAHRADVLIRGLARVGITALVDEATGYEKIKDRDELHRILEAYIAKELLPWTKRFPDEFYEQLFRLRGWQYRPLTVKRPKYVGKLTNELVYEQLPPGVLYELRKKNPVTDKGYRRHKFFQFLTEDIGDPHLEKQITAVTTLMRASPNWGTFYRLFRRAFSGQGEFYFPELEEK
jgi:hypothetical protein